MKTRKLSLQEFKSSTIEIQRLLEVKGGSGSCVTGSPSCVTNVAAKDGDTRGCDTYIC